MKSMKRMGLTGVPRPTRQLSWLVFGLALLVPQLVGCWQREATLVRVANPISAQVDGPVESSFVGSGSASSQPPGSSSELSPPLTEAGSGVESAEQSPEPAPDRPIYNAGGSFEPLNEATRALVWGTPEDEAPEELDAAREELRNRHHLRSCEHHHGLFYEHIRDLGGAYMGVGTDQLYLFIGWMRPELAFSTDYDPWVRELHHIYFYFFSLAEDIESFIGLWNREGRELLREQFRDHPEREMLMTVYSHAYRQVRRRMLSIRQMGQRYGVPTFMSDQEMYRFVRDLILAGRVRPTLSNLLDDTSLIALSNMLGEVEVPLRVFYISNAEEYWNYTSQFRANIAALPFDENSWLLRTIAAIAINDDYRYNIQPGHNYQAWIASSRTRSYHRFYDRPTVDHEEHYPFTITDSEPPR